MPSQTQSLTCIFISAGAEPQPSNTAFNLCTYDGPFRVQQGAAAVPWIDGCVRLHHVLDGPPAEAARDLPARSGNDSCAAQGLKSISAEFRAHNTDAQAVKVAQRQLLACRQRVVQAKGVAEGVHSLSNQ